MGKTLNTLATMGFAAGMLLSPGVHAQDDEHLMERQRLLELIQQLNGDDKRRNEAIRKGQERIMFCAHCHGEDGNSKRPEIPNLAGQNPAYLLEQFEMFADGRRKNFVMQTLAADFSREDKINISVYFANQTVRYDQVVDAAAAAQGKRTYERVCQFCHGESGRGETGYARVAGQQKEYIMATLNRYRKNANSSPDPTEIKRTNVRMEQVTQKMSDDEITAVANFIASLK